MNIFIQENAVESTSDKIVFASTFFHEIVPKRAFGCIDYLILVVLMRIGKKCPSLNLEERNHRKSLHLCYMPNGQVKSILNQLLTNTADLKHSKAG